MIQNQIRENPKTVTADGYHQYELPGKTDLFGVKSIPIPAKYGGGIAYGAPAGETLGSSAAALPVAPANLNPTPTAELPGRILNPDDAGNRDASSYYYNAAPNYEGTQYLSGTPGSMERFGITPPSGAAPEYDPYKTASL